MKHSIDPKNAVKTVPLLVYFWYSCKVCKNVSIQFVKTICFVTPKLLFATLTHSLRQWFPNFSDRALFVGPVLSTCTTLFWEKSMCQRYFDQKFGKTELTQMQHEENGC